MDDKQREMQLYFLRKKHGLDGEDFNLIPHTNDDNSIVVGIRDNEDLSVKEHIVAGIYSVWNNTDFSEELENANVNLKELNSLKKEHTHLQIVAAMTDCLKEVNLLLRLFHLESQNNFTEIDNYVYASLIRNISSFRASLLLVYHSSEFAMIAVLRQAYEQIAYCSYILNKKLSSILEIKKSPNETIAFLDLFMPELELKKLYGELSSATHISQEQFGLYYDKVNKEVIERSFNNVNYFINLFGKISEGQIRIIDLFIKKIESKNTWHREKIREKWASHNSMRKKLINYMAGEMTDYSLVDSIVEYDKLPPL
ncbi:MAG: hypothetical protein RBQ97_11775 [Acholeplasma sp.]|nr:hypothetical protein [Acholeplasma sp.]